MGLLQLSGCVNYAGIKNHSKRLSVSALSEHHTYPLPSRVPPHSPYGWHAFKDAQLNHLIEVALTDSPTVKMAEDRVRRAQYLAKGAAANLWPTINGSAYLQRERFPQYGLVPPPFNGKTFNIGDVGLNFNYEIDFWGKNRAFVAARISELCAAEADLAEARLILSAAIATAYFQLQSDIAQLRIAKDLAHQRQALLNIVETRAERGVTSDIPFRTAIALYQSANASVARLQQLEKLTRDQLAALMGKNPLTTDIALNPFIDRSHLVNLPLYISANVLVNRPDVWAARARAEAAAQEIKVAKAGFFPNFNLTALFSYQSIKLGKLFAPGSQNNMVGGAVDLPLFDAGARRSHYGVTTTEYDLAVNSYNQTVLAALRDVGDQAARLRALATERRAQNVSLAATQRNYNLVKSRYNHGIVDYMQLLDSRGTLLQQQASQVEVETRQIQAVVAMLKALGGSAHKERTL